jgi:hypothetical protein
MPAGRIKEQSARLDVQNVLQLDDGFVCGQPTLLVY